MCVARTSVCARMDSRVCHPLMGNNTPLMSHLLAHPSRRARGALLFHGLLLSSTGTSWLLHTKSINLLVLFNPGIKALSPFDHGRAAAVPAAWATPCHLPLVHLLPLSAAVTTYPSKTGRPHPVQPLRTKTFLRFHLLACLNAVS